MTDDLDFPDVVDGVGDRDAIAAAVKASIEARRADPLKYGLQPHAMQVAFLRDVSRRKIVLAANRVGKTRGAMTDILYCARGEHPYRQVRLSNNIWVGSPDYPSYARFHKPTFDELIPPAWLIQFHETEKWADIRRVDGGVCRISFLSYDMDRTKWQGAGVEHIWLDEEPPEDIFEECMARVVTTRGSVVLTFTPVEGIGWWHDRLWLPATEGKGPWKHFQWALAEYDEENDAEFNVGRSLVPHLTREQIIDFASNYPDEQDRLIRIFGMVRSKKGLVYKQWSRTVHWIPRFPIPRHYYVWGAVDPGYHGFAAAIAAQAPDGSVYIAQEFFSQQETTKQRFKALTEKVRGVQAPEEPQDEPRDPFVKFRAAPDVEPLIVVLFVDTEDPQVVLELNTLAGAVHAEEALEGKAPVVLAFASLDQGLKARKAGHLRVQQMLAPDPARPTPKQVLRPRDDEVGEPQMYAFNDLCSDWQGDNQHFTTSRLLWEIERYSWKAPPKGSTVKRDDGDENTAHGAHMMAAVRYLVMARMGAPEEPAQKLRSNLDSVSKAVWDDLEHLDERGAA